MLIDKPTYQIKRVDGAYHVYVNNSNNPVIVKKIATAGTATLYWCIIISGRRHGCLYRTLRDALMEVVK